MSQQDAISPTLRAEILNDKTHMAKDAYRNTATFVYYSFSLRSDLLRPELYIYPRLLPRTSQGTGNDHACDTPADYF